MTVQKAYISCGIRELTGLYRPAKALVEQIVSARGAPRMFEDFIQVIFSDNIDPGTTATKRVSGGIRLANFIEKNKLGKIMVTRPRINPNSGHNIQTWIWSVNWKNMKEYASDNPATVPKTRAR